MLSVIKKPFQSFFKRYQERVAARYPCQTLCWIEFVEKKYQIEGMVLDLSPFGARVRPLSRFIVERSGALVRLRLERGEIMGEVRNATPMGYGVKFTIPLEDHDTKYYANID
jgi:hypothetical protein